MMSLYPIVFINKKHIFQPVSMMRFQFHIECYSRKKMIGVHNAHSLKVQLSKKIPKSIEK